jgi:ribosomal protein S18 acetylase RimI-like enzyme
MADRSRTVPATPADHHAIADLMAAAFADDPLWTWLIPPRHREARLYRLFTALARHAVDSGQAYLTADRSAVAIWSPPRRWQLPARSLIRAAPHVVRSAGTRLPRLLRRLSDIEAHHARQPPEHWYLEFLATHPSAQGRGLGSALLHDAFQRYDLPIYLETSSEQNLSFYRRAGFTVTGELNFRRGPRQWTLWRAPHESGSAAKSRR